MGSEIGVRLTGENSQFRSMLKDSVERGGDFAGEIANKVGDKLYGLRDISHAIATSLGLNLEKIAEGIARFFTGVSKDEEEAFKKLGEVSDQVADAAIKTMRARLTEEQRYQLALQERDKLVKQIDENAARTAADLLRQKQDELKLIEKSAEIEAYEAKMREEASKKVEEALKAQAAAREKEYQAQLSTLSTDGKIAALKESIVVLQTAISSGVLSQKNAEELTKTITERQVQLKEVEAQKEKELEAARAEAAKKHIEDQDELTKRKFEALSLDDKIAKLEKEHAEIAGNLNKAKAAGLDTTKMQIALMDNENALSKFREEKEKAIHATLGDQVKAMLAQGASEDQIIATLAVRGVSEDEVLKKILEQNDALKEQQSIRISISRTGASYDQQSTTALEGTRDRLKKQIDQIQRNDFGRPGGVGGKATPAELYLLQNELYNIEKELQQRQTVSSYANQYGEDAARRQYGDSLTDKAVKDLTDSQNRTAIAIEDIQQRLAIIVPKK